MSSTNAEAFVHLRDKCAIIKNYPLHRISVRGSLVEMFPEGSPCRTLAINVQNYEKRLSTSTAPEFKVLRHYLGDLTVDAVAVFKTVFSTVTPSLRLRTRYYDQVSALLAAYRLLDLEILRIGAVPTISTPSYLNSVTPSMIEPVKVKQSWNKLQKWQKTLINFCSLVNFCSAIKTRPEKVQEIIADMPFRGSLAHLQGLADSHENQQLNSLIQNFRGAAFHLTLIYETARLDTDNLPGIPESISALIEPPHQVVINSAQLPMTKYQPQILEKIDNYLREHSSGELSLPLHLSLLLTPLFLLMPITQTKAKFPHESIYPLSCALGNQKPEILTRVEKEIWNTLWIIKEDSSMPVISKAFQQLIDSAAFVEAVSIPATDFAFSFFSPHGNGGAASQMMPEVDTPEETANALATSQLVVRPTFQELDAEDDVDMTGTEGHDAISTSQDLYAGIEGENSGTVAQDKEMATDEGTQKDADGEEEVARDESILPMGRRPSKQQQADDDEESEVDEDDEGVGAENQSYDDWEDRNADVERLKDKIIDVDCEAQDTTLRRRSSRKRRAEDCADPARVPKQRKKHSSATAVNEEAQNEEVQNEEDKEQDEEHRWEKLEEDIFVEALDCNLVISAEGKEKLRLGRTVTAWGPQGESLEFTPVCHSKETLRTLQSLIARVEEGYAYGKPLYSKHNGQATRKESIFKIITQEDFVALDDSAVQNILRCQHIVVTQIPHQKQSFEEALLDLAPLDWVTSIQDQSYGFHDIERVRTGKVADILDASRSADSRILNALEFPDPFAGIVRSSFSSDSHALVSVFKQEGWVKKAIPIEHIRWSLAAIAGAFHHWHIDSDGFGTFIDPVTGCKWWIVARPIGDLSPDWFNETSWLKNKAFDLTKDGKGVFDVEAILLLPGSRLIMRPNTLHTVYTPEHAVCRGGHYYATSTMQDTYVGLVHSFICDRFITNTSHFPSRFILAEIINFYHTALVKKNLCANDNPHPHVPDLKTRDSFADLLLVCGLGVLINVLTLQSYTAPGLDPDYAMNEAQAQQWAEYDINGLTEEDRKLFCFARGQSFELIAWLDWNYATGLQDAPIQALFSNGLFNTCKMLCDYKWRADKEKMRCISDFTLSRLQHQITGVLTLAAARNPTQTTFKTIGVDASKWKLPMHNTIAQSILPYELEGVHFQKINQGPYEQLSRGDLFRIGETVLDKTFANRLQVKQEIISAP